ncbi:hypothetical protein ScPMuIL_004879 [Solemya velum]
MPQRRCKGSLCHGVHIVQQTKDDKMGLSDEDKILPDFSLSSAIKEEKHFGFIPSLSYENVDLDPEDTIRTTSLDVDL